MNRATPNYYYYYYGGVVWCCQVENSPFVETLRDLWHEEHLGVFTKSLSARLIQSITFSFFIILGYETIKRWSLLEQYESTVRW